MNCLSYTWMHTFYFVDLLVTIFLLGSCFGAMATGWIARVRLLKIRTRRALRGRA